MTHVWVHTHTLYAPQTLLMTHLRSSVQPQASVLSPPSPTDFIHENSSSLRPTALSVSHCAAVSF